jgi:hypothetical protein
MDNSHSHSPHTARRSCFAKRFPKTDSTPSQNPLYRHSHNRSRRPAKSTIYIYIPLHPHTITAETFFSNLEQNYATMIVPCISVAALSVCPIDHSLQLPRPVNSATWSLLYQCIPTNEGGGAGFGPADLQ